ncbi:MAG: right-handed parallel beta-helix repeat-containing protein [bacterium]|nr:right-handed parallel beta-helix repeat-containing protein [bacterium]
MTLSSAGSPNAGLPAGNRLSPARAAQVLAVLVLVLSQPVASTIINVSGGCTLVDAITAANTNAAVGSCTAGESFPTVDEIRLTADITLTQVDNTIAGDTGTIAGPNGLPVVVSDIVIEGNDHTIARGAGAPVFRILSVASGNLTIQNTTLTNGGGATFDYLGGAISIAFEGGATITLIDSTVSGNSAGGFFGGGGGIYNASNNAVLTGTTISGNSAYTGGGLLNSGIATITNSTLSGNSGGVDKGGAIDNTGTVTLVNSTLSRNSGGGGAINIFSGPANLKNTLLAHNSPVNCRFGSGSIVDNGGNLADDTSCTGIPETLIDLDARLADNGGPTRTHALLEGSAAIDLAGTCGLSTDQRGAIRPGTACDSGAYEFIACPDLELDLAESGEKTYENCQRIVTVPNFAVTGTGNVTLRAGSAVLLGNGTEVDSGGQLEIEIDPDLQLIPPP